MGITATATATRLSTGHDLQKLQSAVRHTDPGRVAELVFDCEEQWKRAHPLQARRVAPVTTVKDVGGRARVTKLVPSALAPVEQGQQHTREDLAALAKSRGFDWAEGHEDRVIHYWASDDRKDRHGDRVVQNWRFDDFAVNPVMLDTHDWGGLTIGGIIDWGVRQRTDEYKGKPWAGDALRLAALFATRETYDRADSIFRLAKAGFMKAGSVGFLPDSVIEVRDKRERAELDLGPTGLIYDDNDLMEWSACAIPAHARAGAELQKAMKAGLLEAQDGQMLRALVSISTPDEEERERQDVEIRAAWRLLFPDSTLPDDPLEPLDPVDKVGHHARRISGVPTTGKGITDLFETLLTKVQTDMAEIRQVVLDIRDGLEIKPSQAYEQNFGEGTPEEEAAETPDEEAKEPPDPGEAPKDAGSGAAGGAAGGSQVNVHVNELDEALAVVRAGVE